MRLIGMLDSPYVRRVAISLDYLDIAFKHEAVSVFSTFEKFQSINPVVKAPSLVCDDGTVLMDSTLILQYAEALASEGRSLMPRRVPELRHALRIIGLALAAGEKSVQLVYEHNLRPKEAQYAPWIARVIGQLRAAYAGLEYEASHGKTLLSSNAPNQAGITFAVVWQFAQMMLPEIAVAAEYPTLARLSAEFEQMPLFKKYPPEGPGVTMKNNGN
jgi:glutathione S-transferase